MEFVHSTFFVISYQLVCRKIESYFCVKFFETADSFLTKFKFDDNLKKSC